MTVLSPSLPRWGRTVPRIPQRCPPQLPSQGVQNSNPYFPLSATASSGTAANAIDGSNDIGRYALWQSRGRYPNGFKIGSSRSWFGEIGWISGLFVSVSSGFGVQFSDGKVLKCRLCNCSHNWSYYFL
jgi:hypothetical protein